MGSKREIWSEVYNSNCCGTGVLRGKQGILDDLLKKIKATYPYYDVKIGYNKFYRLTCFLCRNGVVARKYVVRSKYTPGRFSSSLQYYVTVPE